jgi:hypothetical protein
VLRHARAMIARIPAWQAAGRSGTAAVTARHPADSALVNAPVAARNRA